MDPPHVLKCTRNNMVTKPLEMNYLVKKVSTALRAQMTNRNPAETDESPVKKQKLAWWSVIKRAYMIDQMAHGFHPRMDKLTSQHIDEIQMNKMRVKHAAQVFSNSVAECIGSFAKTGFVGPCPELRIERDEGLNTAEACKFFNDVFDSVNGSLPPKPGAPSLRTPITDDSPYHSFWQTAIDTLKKMRYVDPISLSPPRHPAYPIPSWLMTLGGFQKRWQVLKLKGFTELRPKSINQDVLENYFGLMRAFAGPNDSPSCWQFGGNYKALLINNLNNNKRVGANCEETCEGELLFTLESLLIADSQSPIATMDWDDEVENIFPPLQSNPYFCNNGGDYLLNPADKIREKLGKSILMEGIFGICEKCKVSFVRPRGMNQVSDFDMINGKILQTLIIIMPKICHWRNISAVLLSRVRKIIDDSWMWCELHRAICHDEIMKLIIDQFLLNWCTMLNRHLTGKTNHLKDLPIFQQATQMYEKLYTRRKK